MNALDRLNAASAQRAAELLASCCGAHRWVEAMAAARPYTSADTLRARADRIWLSLTPDDWREAFAHHPRIGERTVAAATEQSRAWSTGEQSSVGASTDATRAALADANLAYERRFGFTYIVRAAGRSAEEMLAMARERLANDPETELRVAAEQQREIMQLRITKLLDNEAMQ